MAIFFIWILTSGYFSVPASGDTSFVWQYAYDAEGRIAEIQSPVGNIHYEYSSITGRKIATWTGTDSQNQFNRTEYTYDDLGRLKEVHAVRCNGAALNPAYITRYDYNKVGSVETITYPNGFHSVHEYNALNRLTELTHYLSAEPGEMMLSRYEYMYYADGMRATAKETLWNSDTESYDHREVQWKYDNLNRVTEEHLLGGYTLEFVYDLTGNCLRRTLDGVTTCFFYNERDELLKESPNADGSNPAVEYEYDANGSMTRKVDHVTGKEMVYEYNLQNRLRAVLEDGQEVASYLYHPEGYRLGKEAGGTMVWYLSDPYNPTGYVQVLEEVTGSSTTTYFYGLHVLGQKTAQNDPMFYLPDGQGSTRQTVQAPVTASPPIAPTMQQMHYDAYGKLIPGAVPPGTNMLYRNQRYDPHLKMYDLRRREYDPANMRFTQHDPFAGSIDDPMSLHRYLYCNANPVNSIDPTGQFTLAEINMANLYRSVMNEIDLSVHEGVERSIDTTMAGGDLNSAVKWMTIANVAPFMIGPISDLLDNAAGMMFKTFSKKIRQGKIVLENRRLLGVAPELKKLYRKTGMNNQTKHAIGELGADWVARMKGFTRVYANDHPSGHGIDQIWRKGNTFLIVEAKGGKNCQLATGQMSQNWIRKNVEIIEDKKLVKELKDAIADGRANGMVVKTYTEGSDEFVPQFVEREWNQIGRDSWSDH
jgi:RHS repeat-associated protein